MDKLILSLENCYGIKKLEAEFDFTKKNTYAIYAPNGVMKTSFAKTFKDLSEKKDSQDLVFPERKTIRTIWDEANTALLPEEAFIIEPYNQDYSSDKLSTLVVKKELKDRYDAIYIELDIARTDFIKKLKKVSQSTDCETEFIETFKENEKETFFDLLVKILPKLNDDIKIDFDFKYNDIFDKKGNVEKFLDKHKETLKLYVDNYESLLTESSFFKKSNNTFGTHQAGEILKSVQDNSFFDAGHSLELNTSYKIESAESFKQVVEDEIQKVINDEKLKKVFDAIDKAIGANAELRAFKKALEVNNLLLIELQDYENFKQKVWLIYLNQLKSDVSVIVDSYDLKRKN